MKKIRVDLRKRSYNILVGKNIISSIGKVVTDLKLAQSCFIITNPKIKKLFGSKLQAALNKANLDSKFCIVADSERSKSFAAWTKALASLANFDKGKGAVVVVALGGGVVGDLAGFVAACYRRGVPFIQVPTTILAQVDSAIGGKVAIDTSFAKNMIGAFYQPKVVMSDIDALRTLPKRQIRSALAEIIKYGIILDKKLFAYIEKNLSKILRLNAKCLEHIIARCSQLKAEVVSVDEKEKLGYRSILNFGHTIGHAIEAASSYKQSLNHGEAIALGMLCAFDIAVTLKLADSDSAARAERLIKKAGLPYKIRGANVSKILKATSFDKKIIKGRRRWILPINIGHVVISSNIPDAVVKEVIFRRISR
ncbi:3-dehydroquinate synthase [Candidatus Omnitrophota bacterium]